MASTSSITYYFITRCLSLSKAHSHFSSRCLSLSKAHYFYCIKIRALYRTSLMFLWELKNGIISQNLRGLCDIKTNIKSTHSGFDKLSTKSFITRCLSLSKAHYFYCIKIRALYRTSLMFLWELKNGIISTNLRELCVIKANTNIPHIVASTSSATSFIF